MTDAAGSSEDTGDWPRIDTPGRYRAKCSCGDGWTGTAREITHWRRLHGGDAGGVHVVSFAGQHISLPGEDRE